MRKVYFSPPEEAGSIAPLLYAAAGDLQHGVRVVATFAVKACGHAHDGCARFNLGLHARAGRCGQCGAVAGAATARNQGRNQGTWIPTGSTSTSTRGWKQKQTRPAPGRDPSEVDGQRTGTGRDQVILFYTIPPDMFCDINTRDGRQGEQAQAQASSTAQDPPGTWSSGSATEQAGQLPDWAPWLSTGTLGETGEALGQRRDYYGSELPIAIGGQRVDVCSNLVEVALRAGPGMVIWAFSAEGWARTWSLQQATAATGSSRTMSTVQGDGSLWYVGPGEEEAGADEDETGLPAPFDGPSCTTARVEVATEPRREMRMAAAGMTSQIASSGMIRRTVAMDGEERAHGIVRIDVEVRTDVREWEGRAGEYEW